MARRSQTGFASGTDALLHEGSQCRDEGPVRLFAADGDAQRVRQPVGGNPSDDHPACAEIGIGSAALRFGSSGKWTRMKFATLGVTTRPSEDTTSVIQASHVSL